MSIGNLKYAVVRVLRMWEFWLNYAVILLILLPFPAVRMVFVLTVDGQEVRREPQMRSFWQCYTFLWPEGAKNLWNMVGVALHWGVPFVLMVAVWVLVLRSKHTLAVEPSGTEVPDE